MVSFENWFTELCANYVWFERVVLHHKSETFKKVCNDVYTVYSADQNRPFPPIAEARVFVSNKINKINPDKQKVDWSKKSLEKVEAEKKQDWQPVSEEEREQWLKKWRESLNGLQTVSAVPRISYKEIAEQGGVLPPKDKPYPITTPEEAYVRDRHFEWIKNNFEAKTGQKLPGWICEEDWNVIYDDKYFNSIGK